MGIDGLLLLVQVHGRSLNSETTEFSKNERKLQNLSQ